MAVNPAKIKEMRAAWEEMSRKIKATPGYADAAKKFEAEYAIAKELYLARKHAKMSQAELAAKLGTTQSVISRMESGTNVSIAKLQEYAAACGGHLEIRIAF